MTTEILPIDEHSLKKAADIIKNKGVVAFPTETVYGLGADAFSSEAVKEIYKVKGRPADNPLIVHVHSDYDISSLVCDIPQYSKELAKAFLPGPLTMIYKSRSVVCPEVSCGLDTLAIRIPEHEGAQIFLRYINMPIAAPSANISKHVSPVTAAHVYNDLNNKIPLILDGGKSMGGIESTVLDCTGDVPCILRSGLITKEMIASVVGSCNEYVLKGGEKVRSPGMKYKHYSPRCETVLFDFEHRNEAFALYKSKNAEGIRTYLLCDAAVAEISNCENILNLGDDENQIAANLYDKLREGESVAQLIIAVAPEKRDGIMVGVMNRLNKAFGKV